MKKSVEILGLPIISITEGRELGMSKTLLIDARAGKITAITIEDEDWYRGVKLIPYESVIAIGDDAVTITNSENILKLDEAGDYENLLDENIRVIGTKAITKTGIIQGTITEIVIGDDGKIESCEITAPDGTVSEVTCDHVSIFGKQVTVIDPNGVSINPNLAATTAADFSAVAAGSESEIALDAGFVSEEVSAEIPTEVEPSAMVSEFAENSSAGEASATVDMTAQPSEVLPTEDITSYQEEAPVEEVVDQMPEIAPAEEMTAEVGTGTIPTEDAPSAEVVPEDMSAFAAATEEMAGAAAEEAAVEPAETETVAPDAAVEAEEVGVIPGTMTDVMPEAGDVAAEEEISVMSDATEVVDESAAEVAVEPAVEEIPAAEDVPTVPETEAEVVTEAVPEQPVVPEQVDETVVEPVPEVTPEISPEPEQVEAVPEPVVEPEPEVQPAPVAEVTPEPVPEPAPVPTPEPMKPAAKPVVKPEVKKPVAKPAAIKPVAKPAAKPNTSANDERHRRFLLGKKAARTIKADTGVVIVEAGADITEEVLQKAKLANKFIELSMNVQ